MKTKELYVKLRSKAEELKKIGMITKREKNNKISYELINSQTLEEAIKSKKLIDELNEIYAEISRLEEFGKFIYRNPITARWFILATKNKVEGFFEELVKLLEHKNSIERYCKVIEKLVDRAMLQIPKPVIVEGYTIAYTGEKGNLHDDSETVLKRVEIVQRWLAKQCEVVFNRLRGYDGKGVYM